MATYSSDLMSYKVPFRGNVDGQETQVTGTIVVKEGTKLTDGDFLKFLRIGQHQALRSFTLSVDGELDDGTVALAGTVGYFQALGPDGNALVVDDKTGTTYTSPASNTDALVAADNTELIRVLQAQGPATATFRAGDDTADNTYEADGATLGSKGLEGPVDLGIEITATANGDAAADVTIRFTATLIRRNATQGEFSGELASAYSNRYTGNSSGGLVS